MVADPFLATFPSLHPLKKPKTGTLARNRLLHCFQNKFNGRKVFNWDRSYKALDGLAKAKKIQKFTIKFVFIYLSFIFYMTRIGFQKHLLEY